MIKQQKSNDLLTASEDLKIARVRAEAAAEQAKADNATQMLTAGLLEANPSYYAYLVAQANSQDGLFPSKIPDEGLHKTGLRWPARTR